MNKIFKRDKRGGPRLWILSVLIMMAISVVSTYGECSDCEDPNPNFDPNNPYSSEPPCIPKPQECTTQRAKLYDFSITTHRTEKEPQEPWSFAGSFDQGYNDLVGYTYVCHWQRPVNEKKHAITNRFYSYFWQTICVCPHSYSSGTDSGHERSEELISDQDIIDEMDTQVASSIFSGPGTGDMLCKRNQP